MTAAPVDYQEVTGALWRVHFTAGSYPRSWSAFRTWGPAETMRYDPHPLPQGDRPGYGVIYTALDLHTAVVETFQQTRRIDLNTDSPMVVSWVPARPLRLLDLTGTWPLANNASHALTSGPRSTCRAWARAIHAHWPDLDGLYSTSTLTGQPNVTVWEGAADAIPVSPDFSEPLHAEAVIAVLEMLTARFPSYRLI